MTETDLELNIKIAEKCGLARILPLKRTTRKGKEDPNGVKLWYCDQHHGGAAEWAEVPNYCKDLNAMHRAEQFLATYPSAEWNNYIMALHAVTGSNPDGKLTEIARIVNSSARQRAEAFVRVTCI